MQSRKAAELRQAWGNKRCNHPDFDKEYYLGAQTGDYVCVQCGECFTRHEKEAIESKRNKQPQDYVNWQEVQGTCPSYKAKTKG